MDNKKPGCQLQPGASETQALQALTLTLSIFRRVLNPHIVGWQPRVFHSPIVTSDLAPQFLLVHHCRSKRIIDPAQRGGGWPIIGP